MFLLAPPLCSLLNVSNLWQHRTGWDLPMHLWSTNLTLHLRNSCWLFHYRIFISGGNRYPHSALSSRSTRLAQGGSRKQLHSLCRQGLLSSFSTKASLPQELHVLASPTVCGLGLSWQRETTKVPLRIVVWLSGQESRGHTVGSEPSRTSPQSGF